MSSTPHKILKQYWGFDSFRSLQENIVNSAMMKNDTLALLPTGGGKSICYQVPGLVMNGLTVVISPLIALMIDQVENLQKRGIKALCIHSGMSYHEIDVALDNAAYGDYKFLYIAPERLQTPMFKDRVSKMPISLIAIDEAHCISQWGYDFRPAYRNIKNIRTMMPEIPVIALTATATKAVCKDIIEQLQLNKVNVFKASYIRENLSYKVIQTENKPGKLKEIILKDSCCIIYTRSRWLCREISMELNKNQIKTTYYHAGLDFAQREKIQNEWIEGKFPVIVATNAFGMGIDKPDVRQVIHLMAPDNLEAYVQEAGRAGRDGKESEVVLLISPGENVELKRTLEKKYPDREQIKKLYLAMGNHFQLAMGVGKDEVFKIKVLEFCKKYNIQPQVFYNGAKILSDNDYISLSDAIFSPPQIKMILTGKDLYRFQINNPRFDDLIKLILRSYSGAYDRFIKLDLNILSKKLTCHQDEIHNLLKQLEKREILKYQPGSMLPTIRFEKDRVNEQFLNLAPETYRAKYKRDLDRIKGMIRYFISDECREKLILEYFGEEGKNCGKCDVCLRSDKKVVKINGNLREVIQYHLSDEAYTVPELIELIPDHSGNDIIKLVRSMSDEGQVSYVSGMRLVWRK